MNKTSLGLLTTLIMIGFLWFSAGAFGRDRALLVDETAERVFTPIQGFLYSVPAFDLVEPIGAMQRTGPGPSSLPWYPDTRYEFLFWGYQIDDLLFFEVHDLFRSQKLLGIVRNQQDRSSLIEDVLARLSHLFRLHRETKLIFSRRELGQNSVILSTLDGKEQTVLLTLENAMINDLWMSPDTRALVYTSDQNYIDEIYLFSLESLSFRELASGDGDNRHPSPLPGRRQIVFWSNRNGMNGIYRMNEDGSTQRMLYSSSYPLRQPASSYDGRLLAFCEFRTGQWKLLLYDTLDIRNRLIAFEGNVSYPRFSPDGKKLIFVGEVDGNSDLYLFDISHDNIQRLTYDSIPKEYPSFSPDGKWVVYAGRKEVSWDIFMVSPEDFIIRRITSARAEERFPSFTPYPVY